MPKLRFPGFEGEWENTELRNLAVYGKDKTKVAKNHFVSTENIEQNFGGIIPFEDSETMVDGTEFSKGDILIANIRPYLKKIWQSDMDGACNADVLVLKPQEIDNVFFYFLVAQNKFIDYVMGGVKGSKMPRGDKTHILQYNTAVPSILEQRQIAKFLSLLSNRIAAQKELVETLKKYKRGLLSAIFPGKDKATPKYRLSGFTAPWERCEFGDLGSISMCKRIFKEQTLTEGDIPFYKIGTFGGEPDAFITRELYEEYKERFQYPKIGDILISASGTIGRTVEYTGEDAYFQDSNIVWFKHDERMDNSFLKCVYSIVKWSGIEGSTIKRLYNDNFLKTEFWLPTVEEQKKIGSYFADFDYLITLHRRKLDMLNKAKSCLMQQLFI